MADNASLGADKTAKNDKFYTQYSDIEAEMNAYVEYNPDVFRGKTILLPCDDPDWGRLYRLYHTKAYSKDKVTARVEELLADTQVHENKGIFEYILGGEQDTALLNIRVFDDKTKKAVYDKQTKDANAHNKSNCPYCAIGHDNNAKRIYRLNEMDADHVTAWSKGGSTDASNCQKKFRQNNNNLAIAYYRYSSHAQNEASIEQQQEAAQKYAEAHGYKIIKEYYDKAISGTTDNTVQ